MIPNTKFCDINREVDLYPRLNSPIQFTVYVALSITVNVVGNGISDQTSNLRRGFFTFHFVLILLWRQESNPSFSISDKIAKYTEFFCLELTTSVGEDKFLIKNIFTELKNWSWGTFCQWQRDWVYTNLYVELVNKFRCRQIFSLSSLFVLHLEYLLPESFKGCPRSVMVKAMDCRIVVREFVLQSRYYVHFRANTLRKGMNPLILPAMG